MIKLKEKLTCRRNNRELCKSSKTKDKTPLFKKEEWLQLYKDTILATVKTVIPAVATLIVTGFMKKKFNL